MKVAHRIVCTGNLRSQRRSTLGEEPFYFDGETYEHEFDHARLSGQTRRVYALMRDGEWRTLNEIEEATGDPPASVSARLRDLRKARFGRHTIEKRPRGERKSGLWEYRLLPKGKR